MIEDAVLAAIASAVDRDGGLDRALSALRRVDPLLRGAARRRLRDAHADALLATTVRQGPGAERHVLRVAYLLLAGTLPPRAARSDVGAIEAAFAEARDARRPARPAFWWPTSFVVLAIAAAAGAGARALAGKPAERSSSAPTASAEPAGPPPSGAFADGGVPARSPADAVIAQALGTDAPAFLIALDRRSDAGREGTPAQVAEAEGEMRAARDRALSPEVREALGPGAARGLERLLAEASAASDVVPTQGSALAEAASALDDALAARGLGYFVDADVLTDTESGRRLVLVYTFRVTSVSLFVSGEATIRALSLRRLDKLNWSQTLLGFTRPTLRCAAVLLDQLEEHVVTLLAPGLADGAGVALFDPEAQVPERAAVEARAGEIVREEYGALPGLDRVAAAKLGKLLGKRKALFARFEEVAAARGLTLSVPATLRLPEGYRKSLEGLASHDDLVDLALVDVALEDATRAGAFAEIRDALAASVERHEVQHRLDAFLGRARPLPMPPELEALVGPPAGPDGKERRQAARARDELSAYLAEIARDPRTPRVGLALVARFLFDQRSHGSAESYAAIILLSGLGEMLGAPARKPLVVDRKVDRSVVSALFLSLAALPPARLREGARALWEKLFSAPLPDLRKIAPPGDDGPPG